MSIRSHSTAWSLVLLALFAAHGNARAEDKLDLRLRLKKGEEYRLRLTVDQHIVQTPPAPASSSGNARPQRRPSAAKAPGPQPQNIDQTLGIGYTMTVEDVADDGAMTITTRYETVLFRQKGPAGSVEFDSAQPPKQVPQAAKAFAALPGLGFKMTLTPGGGVKSVEGLDEMLAEMVRRLELPEGPARAATLKALTDQFGEAAMKQKLQDLFSLYPPGPVAVGESWTRKAVVAKGFQVAMENRYTVKSRGGGVAEIAIEAKVSPNPDAGPVEMGTGKMTYDLSGTQRGSARISEATGWTESLTTEQELGGTLKFDAAGEGDVAIPITVKSKVVMEPVGAK